MEKIKASWNVLDQKQKAAFILTEANKKPHRTSANDTISPKISIGKKNPAACWRDTAILYRTKHLAKWTKLLCACVC